MKPQRLVVLVLAVLLLGSWRCALFGPSNELDDFFFIASKDGQSWRGHAEASFQSEEPKTLVVLGVQQTEQNIVEEVVGVRLTFSGPGTYPVEPEAGFYYTLIGGDVVGRQFDSFGSADDQVVISRYDSTSHIVEGTFRLRLKNRRVADDEVRFRVSAFKAKVFNAVDTGG